MEVLEDGGDGDVTGRWIFALIFSLIVLPVGVQALGTPAPNRPVHLQGLTAVAMTMGERMENGPRKKQKQKKTKKQNRMETRTAKVDS